MLTWHATWQPDPTVPLIGGQPAVKRWSDDGQRWFAAVDRWSGSGSGDTWHSNHEVRGTVAAGTRYQSEVQEGFSMRRAFSRLLDGQ
ncbi:hypothetical protein Tco_1251220, partial [Tanacetum coccineum]